MNVKMILALILLGLVVLFTLGNYEPVTVNLLFWNPSISLALLFFLLLVFGILIGYLIGSHTKKCKQAPEKPVGP